MSTREAALVAEIDRLIAENGAMAASLTTDNNYLRGRVAELITSIEDASADCGTCAHASLKESESPCLGCRWEVLQHTNYKRAQHAAP